ALAGTIIAGASLTFKILDEV
nr:RecName: Full=Magnificalysin I; Short=HMg I; AltName: Full=Cytolysin I; AltName: Full=DELTA-stichotoxin [Heteractis magnifica]